MSRLLFIMVLLGFVYFVGTGLLMLFAPDGSLIKLPLSVLGKSSFQDFKIPGLVMILGVGTILLIALFQFLIHHARRYQWSAFAAIAMLIWTFFQFSYADTSVWIDLFQMTHAMFILLIALQIRGRSLI